MADSTDSLSFSTEGVYSPLVQKTVSLGNKEYALKNYEKAAEYYGQASELQCEETGHDDADLLLLYGKALFHVAQKNSQVLGGVPASESSFDPKQVLATAPSSSAEPEGKSVAKISFSGDAEEEDGEDNDDDEPEKEKEDDFQIAWEVLEAAKSMFESLLEARKSVGLRTQEDTSIERKIADTCDLLGEVSIENESFDTAVQDLTRALELKVSLYETSNPIVSEAHYKLSLALEFAQSPSPEQNKFLALQHLESAIASVKERVKILESAGNSTDAANAREMIDELAIKVEEMKNPQKQNIDVSSIFGSGANINEVLQQKIVSSLGAANDLTGLVRKKEKPQIANEAGNATVIAGEKRKIEGNVVGSPGKKVRVEDTGED